MDSRTRVAPPNCQDLKYPKSPSFHEEDVSDKPFIIRDLRRTGGLFETEEADELFVKRVQSMQAVDEMVAELVQVLEETGQLDNPTSSSPPITVSTWANITCRPGRCSLTRRTSTSHFMCAVRAFNPV
jgi:hypothetical protein